jgi:hypothetical protein
MPRVSNVDTVAPDEITTATSSPTRSPRTKSTVLQTASGNPTSISSHLEPPITETVDKIYEMVGHTKSPFSSFLINPKVFNFAEKNDNETIFIALRPHWFTNVHWILITFFMVFVPSLLKYVPLLSGFSPNIQFMAIVFWYLVTFIYAFEKFLSWYFDVYIITNERVIDISFENLLDKRFAEAEITKIQDVSSEVIGLTQTIFNYGRILIQTASEIDQIHFENIPNPDKVIKVIEELRHEEVGQNA